MIKTYFFHDHAMTSPSAHTDLDTLIHNMDQLAEASHLLGHQYVTLPAIPDDRRQSLDEYRRIAETFNRIGENAKKAGIKFAYHNHGYGIKPWGEVVPLKLFLIIQTRIWSFSKWIFTGQLPVVRIRLPG
jgi:hypothetical protein